MKLCECIPSSSHNHFTSSIPLLENHLFPLFVPTVDLLNSSQILFTIDQKDPKDDLSTKISSSSHPANSFSPHPPPQAPRRPATRFRGLSIPPPILLQRALLLPTASISDNPYAHGRSKGCRGSSSAFQLEEYRR